MNHSFWTGWSTCTTAVLFQIRFNSSPQLIFLSWSPQCRDLGKACTDDWLSFSTWYRLLHLQSNNHLYLGWHQSGGANNPVNIGDECSQHWAAVLARKNQCEPSASNWCLLSLGGVGGLWKVYQPELVGCRNHSRLRFAIRSEGVSFSSVFFGVASQWVNECACANEPNSFEFFLSSHPVRNVHLASVIYWFGSLFVSCYFL